MRPFEGALSNSVFEGMHERESLKVALAVFIFLKPRALSYYL